MFLAWVPQTHNPGNVRFAGTPFTWTRAPSCPTFLWNSFPVWRWLANSTSRVASGQWKSARSCSAVRLRWTWSGWRFRAETWQNDLRSSIRRAAPVVPATFGVRSCPAGPLFANKSQARKERGVAKPRNRSSQRAARARLGEKPEASSRWERLSRRAGSALRALPLTYSLCATTTASSVSRTNPYFFVGHPIWLPRGQAGVELP
jgi:hypothetical protein